jgi:hydrogenase expression/formation protein HypC
MCLSIPAKVLAIEEEEMARVSVRGVETSISLQLVDDVKPGDFVLVHTGFALQKLSEEEAQESLRILAELDAIMDEEEELNQKNTDGSI